MKIILNNQKAGGGADTEALRIAQQAIDEGWTGLVGVVSGKRKFGVRINKTSVSVWPDEAEPKE